MLFAFFAVNWSQNDNRLLTFNKHRDTGPFMDNFLGRIDITVLSGKIVEDGNIRSGMPACCRTDFEYLRIDGVGAGQFEAEAAYDKFIVLLSSDADSECKNSGRRPLFLDLLYNLSIAIT